MNSNIETPPNHEGKERIKPENYTNKMYDYFRGNFTANLTYIRDNGACLETDIFFDLCIGNIQDAPWYLPEMIIWFQKRKLKIQTQETYELKMEEFKIFFESYRIFFEPSQTYLSGCIQIMMEEILQNNPTS